MSAQTLPEAPGFQPVRMPPGVFPPTKLSTAVTGNRVVREAGSKPVSAEPPPGDSRALPAGDVSAGREGLK